MPSGVAFPDKQHCELAYGPGNCVAGPDGTWIGNVVAPPKASSPPSPPLLAFPDQQSCEVAFGAGNCTETVNGDWYATAALATSTPSTLSPTTDWDPISWGKSAISDVTGFFGATEKWVIKQIAKAAGLVENDIAKVWSWLYARFGGVENTISHLAGEINSVIGGIPHDIASTLSELRHDIAADVDADVKAATRGLGDVKSGLESILSDAERYADRGVADFKKDVIDPLERDLRRAIHDAESAADHAWHVWYSDIWAPAEHELAEARHDAAKAISFIDHSALDAIHLIDECWDWLERLAHNPLKSLEALPGELRTALPKAWTETAAEPDTAVIDKVVSWLEEELPNV